MILIKSLVLFCAILCVCFGQLLFDIQDSEAEVIAEALKKILVDIFVPINKTINVITSEETNGLIVRRMVESYGDSMNFEIKTCDNPYQDEVHFKATIIILDNKLMMCVGDFLATKRMMHLFYVSGMSLEDYFVMLSTVDHPYIKTLPNDLLLIDEGDHLSLRILTYFTETSCTETSLKIVNRFSKASQQWELPTFDLKPHFKFHGCELITNCNLTQPPEIIRPASKSTNFDEYSGYFADITNELARRLNFTMNVTNDGVIENAQIMFYGSSIMYKLTDEMVVKQRYLTTINRNIFFLVPLGDYYTGLEKLFLPYDLIGWVLIVLTFSIGLIVIQVVVRLSKVKQNFVFGRRVTTPSINMTAAFFGIGQIVLPGRNFGRFILMLYIIWCLIIRTAYQGILYELLKSDGRRPQNLEIEDFLQGNIQNLTLHMNDFCWSFLHQTPEMNHKTRLVIYNESNVHEHFEYVKKSFGDHYMIIDDLQFAISNQKEAFTNVKILKNENIRVPLKFADVAGYFMEELFKAKLLQMQEAGLIEYWKRKYYDPKYLDLMEEEGEPKILTVEQLSIGFQVFLLFSGVAIAVFVIEIVKFKWQKQRDSRRVFPFIH